jgi:branched-chain amino acid transport system ATP-binding protein
MAESAATAPTEPAPATSGLQIRGLLATYGAVRALDHVDIDVPAGHITAVLGANGAGKTTLLRSINGLVRPKAGTITYDGRQISGLKPENVVRQGIAHVPEGRGVIAELTVEENLRLGALWRGKRSDMNDDLARMYDMFPALADRRKRTASTLSGGERQMLVIGRALMSRPQLLLLDEPSLGLAPRITAQIMSQLGALRDRDRLTVLLVEQNARSALAVADHAVVLNLGRVAVAARASELEGDEQLRHAYLGF